MDYKCVASQFTESSNVVLTGSGISSKLHARRSRAAFDALMPTEAKQANAAAAVFIVGVRAPKCPRRATCGEINDSRTFFKK